MTDMQKRAREVVAEWFDNHRLATDRSVGTQMADLLLALAAQPAEPVAQYVQWRLALSAPSVNPETHPLGQEIVPVFQRVDAAPPQASTQEPVCVHGVCPASACTNSKCRPSTQAQDAAQPLDTVNWWADAYARQGGHAMVVSMLRDYARLRATPPSVEDETAQRDKARKEFWNELAAKGDPLRVPNQFTVGFNAGWKLSRAALKGAK